MMKIIFILRIVYNIPTNTIKRRIQRAFSSKHGSLRSEVDGRGMGSTFLYLVEFVIKFSFAGNIFITLSTCVCVISLYCIAAV